MCKICKQIRAPGFRGRGSSQPCWFLIAIAAVTTAVLRRETESRMSLRGKAVVTKKKNTVWMFTTHTQQT